jgi:hypothetical protein
MDDTPVFPPMTSGSTTYPATASRPRNSPSVATTCHHPGNWAKASAAGSAIASSVPTNPDPSGARFHRKPAATNR